MFEIWCNMRSYTDLTYSEMISAKWTSNNFLFGSPILFLFFYFHTCLSRVPKYLCSPCHEHIDKRSSNFETKSGFIQMGDNWKVQNVNWISKILTWFFILIFQLFAYSFNFPVSNSILNLKKCFTLKIKMP